MVWLKSFAAFILLQLGLWGGAHTYLTLNPEPILVVVDTSYAMKPHFNEAKRWIEDFEANSRYKKIYVGTDKAEMGALSDLRSKDTLFRTAFGRLSTEKLDNLYARQPAATRYLLSSEVNQLDGWSVVNW